MGEDPGSGIGPLDWPGLVDEAVRRRKRERLSQKRHAALAGVSVPTMIAFDRKETTLTLDKIRQILDVVGLWTEPGREAPQDAFVGRALARWRELIEPLAQDDPARMSYGAYRTDYRLEGRLSIPGPKNFLDGLSDAVVRYSGWPPFWIPRSERIHPRPIEGDIECWLGGRLLQQDETSIFFHDASLSDYWRASPEGRMFLLRGFEDDGRENAPPGRFFDLTLPIRRAAEILLHAESFGRRFAPEDPEAAIHLRLVYGGLRGRRLIAWANPDLRELELGERRSGSDEVTTERRMAVGRIGAELAEHVHGLLKPLYERFDFYILPKELVEAEIGRLLEYGSRQRFLKRG